MKLQREERLYLHLPFWGLAGSTPQVQVGAGAAWVTMTSAPSFTPDEGWAPPTGFAAEDAEWWQVLLAGPDATGNPLGTIVVAASSRIRTKITAGDEIDVQPDGTEWIHLVS